MRIGILLPFTAAILFGLATASSASLISNGDFEINTAGGTLFNMSNAAFTSTVADATGFGTSEELDLVTGTDFGIAPQSGDWKVGMHQRTNDPANADAFSLSLTSALVIGTNYTLNFWGAMLSGAPAGVIDIGLSNSALDFGTAIFSGTPLSPTVWTEFTSVFSATSNATFLTVRVGNPFNGYAFVDNFSLTAAVIPLPATLPLLIAGLAAFGLARRRRPAA